MPISRTKQKNAECSALGRLTLLLTRNVYIHYTPTNSSWLNQIEIWFAKIQRDVIARDSVTNIKDLCKKIMRHTSASTTRSPSPFNGSTTTQSIELQTISLIQ